MILSYDINITCFAGTHVVRPGLNPSTHRSSHLSTNPASQPASQPTGHVLKMLDPLLQLKPGRGLHVAFIHGLVSAGLPRQQSSWGQHGAHLGLVGPRWAPCWSHESCYQEYISHFGDGMEWYTMKTVHHVLSTNRTAKYRDLENNIEK